MLAPGCDKGRRTGSGRALATEGDEGGEGEWIGSGPFNGEWRPSSGWILAPGCDGGAEQGVEGCRTTGSDGGK